MISETTYDLSDISYWNVHGEISTDNPHALQLRKSTTIERY